ncbi:MAG: phosphoenolpyruvate--protein phosphotransferase [Pseudomonadota bacterium]
MSFSMHGTAVSGGIAIGYAHLVSQTSFDVAHYTIPVEFIDKEITRFDTAIVTVRGELFEILRTAPASAPAEFTAFVDLHGMILEDPMLTVAVRELILEQHCNAEWALKLQMEALIDQFDNIEDAYLRERKVDVRQVVERILKALMGQPGQLPVPATTKEASSILVAHDLSPADMILFKQHDFAGFITDLGGTTSHTAILARSIAIPSVVALHMARELIEENDLLILDGSEGIVIIDPDRTVLSEYKLRQQQWDLERQKLRRLRTTKTTTVDGTPVSLFANIELPSDVEEVRESGATGIGLFRSEFLFLNRMELPNEDEQFEAYRTVAEKMRGKPVTIRTLDLGADKNLAGHHPIASNPALGLRAIRYCLAEPQMFMTQLRAILRASKYGRICILLPMISTLSEVNQALVMIEDAKQQLRDEKIDFWEKIAVGAMVETPAAALALHMFAHKLNFLSIGSNDLIQYTLAIDRADDAVAHLYNPLHPAILMLLSYAVRGAEKAGIPIGVCGEIAGEEDLTRVLLGLGIRHLSMHPSRLLPVKQQVLKTNLPDVTPLVQRILRAEDSDKILGLVEKLNA